MLPCLHITLAMSSWARLRGLLGRPPLKMGQALWLSPCSAIHTLGMSRPIDVVFLDACGRPIRCVPSLPPGRMCICLRACSVLELPEGGLQHLDSVWNDSANMVLRQ